MKKKIIKISILLTSLVVLGGYLNKEKYNQNDETLAIFLNEERTESIPSKEEYSFDKAICTVDGNVTEDVKVEWDEESWAPILYNVKDHSTKCNLYFKENYEESILNGTYPILKDGLIPITIDSDGTVKKANLGKEWYSYEKKNWANAVILEDPYDSLNTKGKVHGATKEEGYVSFDGVDDYINLGLGNYDFKNQITMSITFELPQIKSDLDVREFFSNFDSSGAGISLYNIDQIGFWFYSTETNSYQRIIGPKLEANKKYTVTAIYDGTKMKLYVNGVKEAEVNASGDIRIAGHNFYLAANPGGSFTSVQFSNYTNIDVYEAKIYNRAISEKEIKALNDGKIINTEGLLKYVNFTNKTYQSEEIIPEDAIESYFVWIPKYRYQLWDLGEYDELTEIDESKVHEIPIIFGDYNTSESVNGECTTPMESGATGNCEVGDYMTHPAFLSIPSKGFWVGKFETGYNGATTTEEAEQNIVDSSKIIVKPNVYSWRGIQPASAFYTSYDYQRNLDSHMMKNTEWGAVAYLQLSKYGSMGHVRANNNNDCITGFAAVNKATCGGNYTSESSECNQFGTTDDVTQPYNTAIGFLASTTGNITGIYDMSGGSHDNVMAVEVSNNQIYTGLDEDFNSGFNGLYISDTGEKTDGLDIPSEQYYDKYNYNEDSRYTAFFNRILGDATGELGPFELNKNIDERQISSWYSSDAHFAGYDNPWFARGNSYFSGSRINITVFGSWVSTTAVDASFRLVLTPN